MNYLGYQLFASLHLLQGNPLESEADSPENLGSQTYYCLISSTVVCGSNLNDVFLPSSTADKPSSCAYKQQLDNKWNIFDVLCYFQVIKIKKHISYPSCTWIL